MASIDEHSAAYARANAGLAPEGQVHAWSGDAAYSDIWLEAGSYRFDGAIASLERIVLEPMPDFEGTLVVTETTGYRVHRGRGQLQLVKET